MAGAFRRLLSRPLVRGRCSFTTVSGRSRVDDADRGVLERRLASRVGEQVIGGIVGGRGVIQGEGALVIDATALALAVRSRV